MTTVVQPGPVEPHLTEDDPSAPPSTEHASAVTPRPWMRRRSVGLVAASALVLGGGIATGRALTSSTPARRADHAPAVPAALATPTAITLPAATSPVGPAASSPQAAVEQFLRGERDGDAATSYSALSAADRGRIGTIDSWRDNHNGLPQYRGFTFVRTSADGHVVESVDLVPALDEVDGYVPGHATATFATVAQDSGYRIDLAHSTLEPIAADDAGIVPAATTWIKARQACSADTTSSSGDATGNETAGNLLGQPSAATALCGTTGPVTFGTPKPIDGALGDAVKTAYGPDATRWAKAIDVDGTTKLTIALGPLGDDWVVVGVINR